MDEYQESQSLDPASTDMMSFPIVGIGASAGGLPAMLRLLEQMPPAPGMALVVVLHLAPDTPSAADRLLQRVTGMPVRQVRERVRLEPNHVYVISPGRGLKMDDGHLVAIEPSSASGRPMTIDVFMRTLAETHGARAIGVLLSGMGSDGAAGLASIKEHGGIAIAQLPDDAEESSMPQSAIDAGVVDFVLPAAEMPARLLELCKVMQAVWQGSPEGEELPTLPHFSGGADNRERLDDILALLCAHTGQDFRHYKEAMVLRRIEKRMLTRDMPDLPSYLRLLEQDRQEPDLLAQELLIGVTNFFRDRDAFHALERSVLPNIFQEHIPGQPLRAWVAGCSTGEEAYSLAMLLAEHVEDIDGAPAMQIFATDVDERALAVARAGRYPDTIAADVAAERLARYFTPGDGYFRVRKLLRDRILFARHDLLHDPAFSKLDLIACRNVLIYLNREMHRHLLEVFYSALKPGGYLFLGSAESTELGKDLFVAVNSRHKLYQARPHGNAVRRLLVLPAIRAQRWQGADGVAAPAPESAPPPPSFAELHQRMLVQVAPPSVLVNARDEIVHVADAAAAFLRYGGGEPSTQILALALPELRIDLRSIMFQARKSGKPVQAGPVRYTLDGSESAVSLSAMPVRDAAVAEDLLLVRFDPVEPVEPAPGDTGDTGEHGDAVHQRVRELEAALLRAQANLARTIEQADAARADLARANEALQARVDGLRASVEELEIHREEMQSRNEELYTVNAELQIRLDETSNANDDLSNLIASSDIATLFLDQRLCIQRYTPHVTRIFNIIPADVGRPLAHITSRLEIPRLLDEITGVFASGQPIEREARSSDGRDYIVRVHPYRTAYERLEGTVLTFFDISRRRMAEKALRESEQRLATAFAALPLGLGIIAPDGKAIMLNEVMRRFTPTGLLPSHDPARAARWRSWDATGAPVAPADFPGARALRGESVMCGMQMLYTDEEGVETWTEVRSAPLLDGEGKISGVLAVVIDVDRLKRSEEAAQQSAQRQAFLLALSDALRAEPDADAVAKRALAMMTAVLKLDRCCIVSCRPDDEWADVTHQAGNKALPALPGRLRLSDPPQAFCATAGRTLVVKDLERGATGQEGGPAASWLPGMRALAVTTLREGEHTPAWSLAAICAAPRSWTPEEVMLLEEAAERIWLAAERSRAEAATARAERRAENILERMSEAHCVLGPDYRMLVVNAAAERLLGRERAALLGRLYWDAFPETVDAPVGSAFRRVVDEGVEQHFTHHYTGGGCDLRLEADAYPTDEGGVAIFWRDVTEKLRAAQALQASEEKYRALFNEMDEAYAVVEVMADGEGRWNDFLFLDANPAFMRHTGMPYPVGRTAIELLGTPNPRWAELYGRVVETGEAVRVEEGELTLGRVFDLNIFRLGGEGSRRVAVLFRDVTEERRTQEALRRSEERYRMLFEASPMPFIVTAPDAPHFTVVGVNDAYLGATMRTRESLVGRPLFEAFPDDPAHGSSSVLRASFERVLATRQQDMMPVMQYDMVRPDGSFEERWWIPLQSPVLDDDGQVQAIIHSATDVTDIHRAGTALRASEERQAFLLKLSDDVRALTSVEEIQSVTNRLLGTYLGTDRAMFAEVEGEPGAETGFIRTQYIRPADPGQPSLAPFPERFTYGSFGKHTMAMRYRGDLLVVDDIDSSPDFTASERAAWAAASVQAAVVVPLARGGRLLAEVGVHSASARDWTEAEVSLIRDVGERTLAALERAQTAKALQESEARFRALAEASPALIWQLDSTGALSYVNGRCLDLAATTIDDLRDLGWQSIVHPDDMADYVGAVEHALRTQGGFERRVRLRQRDGGHRWFDAHALPWQAADGQFRGLVGMSVDVDETVQAEEALMTADRRKDEFLATLAHELRNPLAPISNALQFLRHPGGKRRADRLLTMVERQVRHMVRLVDDLMEVTRISRGKVDLQRAPLALADVLGSAVETSLPALEAKRQRLTVEPLDETFKLDADKVRLTQVFANLLNNAAKYTPPEGQVWLSARREEHEVRVSVRDTGMGIPREQLPLIFEMFSQPHGKDGHSDSGLGIGLAMVRSLVEMHGGSVEAYSAGRDQGSEFVVRLPLIDCPDAVLRDADRPAEAGTAPLSGQRILIVDDNRDAADSLCHLLAARGAETQAVYGGRAALETLERLQPQAIVLDIGMPDMDGYELAQRIRHDGRAPGAQIIALSGWGQQADRERSRASGFDHHLTKPADLASLLGILSRRGHGQAGGD